MAELTTIARPYAEALFRRAGETGQYAQWSDKLELLAAVAANETVAAAIANPRMTRDQRVALMSDICGDRLDDEGRNLLMVLADNHRLKVLGRIAEQYEALRHEMEGVLDAMVASAFPLDEAQIASLTNDLTKHFGKRFRTQVTVDSALLGGICISVGDVVIDGSVRARLEQMAVALKH